MRIPLIAFAAALTLSVPAAAGTLEEVTTKGEILTVQGMDIDVKFTPDGKFTALDGQITGTWKIDGDKLCTRLQPRPDRVLRGLSQGQEVRRQLRGHRPGRLGDDQDQVGARTATDLSLPSNVDVEDSVPAKALLE